MIPKIIHYCWYGESNMPPLVVECIASWKKFLPDYEIIRWDETNSPRNSFIEYHLKNNNWAFVSDYVRLFALYQFGGIYLDTDVEVIKSFDDLLINSGFVGLEENNRANNAVAGSEKGNIFFRDCMKYIIKRYENELSYHISPIVTTNILNSNNYDIKVYNPDYFYPYNPYDKSKSVSIFMYSMLKKDTHAIHHWAKSWDNSDTKMTDDNQKYLGSGLCVFMNSVCTKLGEYTKVYLDKLKLSK